MEIQEEKEYIAIDLKSFYASVECRERGLDPLTTNLVVADPERTAKTICLAVSPSLKAYGIPGRARLFEVVQRVREVNAGRRAAGRRGRGGEPEKSSWNDTELRADPELMLDYLTAVPRMSLYIEYSTRIYRIYLHFIAPEDIHVYSIDEILIDATSYRKLYHVTARELARRLIRAVQQETGIPATAGVAPNLFLCKAAMDIVAKHIPADEDGVRIAELDEKSYRRQLWTHMPITDFWRVGRGYARRLRQHGMLTMGDVARCSLQDEELLYRLFGINAELLIDHAWGRESCGMKEIKAFRPSSNSLGSGQVLQGPCDHRVGAIVLREMAEALVLGLVDRRLVTNQIMLYVGYDVENLKDPSIARLYHGEIKTDHYGRRVPKSANASLKLEGFTSSSRRIVGAFMKLFEEITEPYLLIRRFSIAVGNVAEEGSRAAGGGFAQMDLFSDFGLAAEPAAGADVSSGGRGKETEEELREKRVQQAMLDIRKKYGKNAIVKGTDLQEGATGMDRNRQIGGHRA
ncbi:Y-family DNA polymerase [Lachnoclostridium sp. Marseille-P6806]|uniref:Y-family DNA polymerase n=1 Tax=Lachnoclostridium sp. Marseille-P6806 TaxID=2364793 RepID=UPI001030F924|nr:DNA methylase [Lachnoclostridium sp. Marseille-P6806]